MRIYRSDGSFVDDPNDTEFGWFFREITIDETILDYERRNHDMKMSSFLRKSFKKDFLNESVDYSEANENIQIPIEIIKPDVEIEPVKDYINCEDIMNNLYSICNAEEFRNIENEKDKLANNMTPCSIEAKMLLCVINHAKFKSLQKKETSEKLFNSVNFKSTNLKFLLSEQKSDFKGDIFSDIIDHDIKEKNMPCLMMDLISTDIDCNIDNLVNVNDNLEEQPIFPRFVIDTSDLGNSIPSSSSSRDEKYDKHYLPLPLDKSNILYTLGLSEEEKSIQTYCEETYEMHKELAIIKRSFKVSE